MTDPQVAEPDNLLHEARDLLHDAAAQLLTELGELLPDRGFHAEHADRWPTGQPHVPGGWIDVPSLSRITDANTVGTVATFPVLFPLSGDDQAQVQLQDMILSRGWDLLDGRTAGQMRSRVLTAGPADIDVGGGVSRGVVFTVQVRLLVRTLCPSRITSTQTA